jgi:hypothetical protein
MKTTITLTTDDIIDLMLEKTVQRENIRLCPNFSFLAIMARLSDEMNQKS